MTEAKKKLKILLRPGESEKRPDLAWPKSFKKEPVEVVAVCKPSLAWLTNRMLSSNWLNFGESWGETMKMGTWRKYLISGGVVEIVLGYSRNDGKRSLKIGSESSRKSLTHPESLSSTIAYVLLQLQLLMIDQIR
jgi:hypothetical protein